MAVTKDEDTRSSSELLGMQQVLFWYAVCPILLTSCILRHYYLHFTDEETQAQTQRASFRRSGHGNRDDMGGGETADQTPLGYVSLSSYVRFVLTIYRKTHTHTQIPSGLESSIQDIQSILKEIRPGISLEGMMLKLKLQYFGHLM